MSFHGIEFNELQVKYFTDEYAEPWQAAESLKNGERMHSPDALEKMLAVSGKK